MMESSDLTLKIRTLRDGAIGNLIGIFGVFQQDFTTINIDRKRAGESVSQYFVICMNCFATYYFPAYFGYYRFIGSGPESIGQGT
jgi:hypothetical protein